MPFTLTDAAVRYAVIGDPVAHSVSPVMQNAAFEAAGVPVRYGKFHVLPEELPAFCEFARANLDGFNATVPHKKALLRLLDEVTPEAQAAGSVNTVTVRNGRLCGDSTDGCGLETALHEAFGVTPAGSTFLFLGAGGAAQAAAFFLARRGAKKIIIVNRTLAHAEALAGQIHRAPPALTLALSNTDADAIVREVCEADVVIQATSAGLKTDDAPPLTPELLIGAKACFEMIYRPTALLEFMQSQGIPAVDGRLMLLHQGAKSWSLWNHRPAPVEAMRRALDAVLT